MDFIEEIKTEDRFFKLACLLLEEVECEYRDEFAKLRCTGVQDFAQKNRAFLRFRCSAEAEFNAMDQPLSVKSINEQRDAWAVQEVKDLLSRTKSIMTFDTDEEMARHGLGRNAEEDSKASLMQFISRRKFADVGDHVWTTVKRFIKKDVSELPASALRLFRVHSMTVKPSAESQHAPASAPAAAPAAAKSAAVAPSIVVLPDTEEELAAVSESGSAGNEWDSAAGSHRSEHSVADPSLPPKAPSVSFATLQPSRTPDECAGEGEDSGAWDAVHHITPSEQHLLDLEWHRNAIASVPAAVPGPSALPHGMWIGVHGAQLHSDFRSAPPALARAASSPLHSLPAAFKICYPTPSAPPTLPLKLNAVVSPLSTPHTSGWRVMMRRVSSGCAVEYDGTRALVRWVRDNPSPTDALPSPPHLRSASPLASPASPVGCPFGLVRRGRVGLADCSWVQSPGPHLANWTPLRVTNPVPACPPPDASSASSSPQRCPDLPPLSHAPRTAKSSSPSSRDPDNLYRPWALDYDYNSAPPDASASSADAVRATSASTTAARGKAVRRGEDPVDGDMPLTPWPSDTPGSAVRSPTSARSPAVSRRSSASRGDASIRLGSTRRRTSSLSHTDHQRAATPAGAPHSPTSSSVLPLPSLSAHAYVRPTTPSSPSAAA